MDDEADFGVIFGHARLLREKRKPACEKAGSLVQACSLPLPSEFDS